MALAVIQFPAVDESGNVLTNVSVEVRAEITGSPLVAVYEDRAGATALGNAFVWADGKMVRFYVAPGRYKITVTKGAYTATLRDVVALDDVPSEETVDPTEVTAGPTYNMVATDEEIWVNQTVNGAITINLVTAVGRTKPIKIRDKKGNASSFPITIDGNGTETIMGALTYVINFDHGSITLWPDQDGKWYS